MSDWELEVEAESSELYKAMKVEFDRVHVPKELQSFTVRDRRGQREFQKEVAMADSGKSLQFRKILKFVQALDTKGKIKVHCGGNSKSASSVFVTVVEL